jgi:hypothetical protein
VKVTDVPAQIVPDGDAVIVTPAGAVGFTTIVIAFDVAGLGAAQPRLDVIFTVIASPLLSDVEV